MAIPVPVVGQEISAQNFGIPVANQLNINSEWMPHQTRIDQGVSGVAATSFFSEYTRSGPTGKLIHYHFYLNITGNGNAGTAISITIALPFTDGGSVAGAGFIYDNSSSVAHQGLWVGGGNSTTIILIPNGTAGSGVGHTPNFGLAAGDQIRGHVIYKAA